MPEICKMCLGVSSGFVKYRIISRLSGKVIRSSSFVFRFNTFTTNGQRIPQNPVRKMARGRS
jgi:hypothetical protein